MPAKPPAPEDRYIGHICASAHCTLSAFIGYDYCPRCLARKTPDDAHNVGVVEPPHADDDTRPMEVPTPKRVRLADGMSRTGVWVELEDE